MRLSSPALLTSAALLLPSPAAAALVSSSPVTAPRAATVDLTAHRIRIGDHPALVRVVVDFTDGRLGSNDSEAADPDPFRDGRVSVDVRHRRIRAQALPRRAHGLRVRVGQRTNRIRVRVSALPGRFKYLRRYQLSAPDRLVLDFYKSRPPGRAARILRAPDGCLSLEDWSVARNRIRVSGLARFLFENSFQLIVRDARGRPVGDRIVTVADPSGRWLRRVPYRVGRAGPGTLEAVAMSARDGALDCLAQTRVRLRP